MQTLTHWPGVRLISAFDLENEFAMYWAKGLLLSASCAAALAEDIVYSTKGSDVQYPVSINGVNLLSATTHELSSALEEGRVTTTQLVQAYIARAKANDHQGLSDEHHFLSVPR